MLLHTSWIVTLLIRAFHHESIYIIRWATETVLLMDFASVPFMEQGQLQVLLLLSSSQKYFDCCLEVNHRVGRTLKLV